MKPKVGDRVRFSAPLGPYAGLEGTVEETDNSSSINVFVKPDGRTYGTWRSTSEKASEYWVELLPRTKSTKSKVKLGVSDDTATYEPTYTAISPKDKEEIAELVIAKLAKLLGGNSNDDY